MTESINCTNQQQTPSYSGVTINITNPALNIPPRYNCPPPEFKPSINNTYPNQYNNTPNGYINKGEYLEPISSSHSEYARNLQQAVVYTDSQGNIKPLNRSTQDQQNVQQTYPQEYYINNYASNPNKQGNDSTKSLKNTSYTNPDSASYIPVPDGINSENNQENSEDDLKTSQNIINELDTKNEEQKDLEKNGKETRIVSLTNEYIMSLENYLNNPNSEIRLMAAKEILTRLDEDKNRYDDVALNALLNKMLQDPNKLIRIAAMSAFSSELASGNDYTVQLLNQIQQNPQSDPEDVLEASQILLKRSTSTEVRYTPINNNIPQQEPLTEEQKVTE